MGRRRWRRSDPIRPPGINCVVILLVLVGDKPSRTAARFPKGVNPNKVETLLQSTCPPAEATPPSSISLCTLCSHSLPASLFHAVGPSVPSTPLCYRKINSGNMLIWNNCMEGRAWIHDFTPPPPQGGTLASHVPSTMGLHKQEEDVLSSVRVVCRRTGD